MRLNDRQRAVLARLCEKQYAQTGAEIVDALWRTKLFTSHEQGQRTAKQLVKKGLAVALGYSLTGARCYTASARGGKVMQAILEQEGGE